MMKRTQTKIKKMKKNILNMGREGKNHNNKYLSQNI